MGRGASFTPPKRGGGALKSFSHAAGGGGHNNFWGSFETQELEVSAILKGDAKSFRPLIGGGGA